MAIKAIVLPDRVCRKKRIERLLREKTSRLVWLIAWGFTAHTRIRPLSMIMHMNKKHSLTGIVLPLDVRCLSQDGRIDGGVEAMIVRRRKTEDCKSAAVELETRRVRRIEVQQRRNREFVPLDPKLARKVNGGVGDESTVRRRTEPSGVVCVLDRPCIGLEFAVKELVESGVVLDIWIKELVEGDLVGADKGWYVLDALWGIIDPPLANALFTEEVLDAFTTLEHLDLFLAAKEEVHAESSVDGHTLEEFFSCFSVDDKVSDIVFAGEGLELRHKFVEERVMGVGCGVNSLCYIAAAPGWLGVLDKARKTLGDVVVVCTGQTRLCLDVLDGFGDVVEIQVHGGRYVAMDMICGLSISALISPVKQLMKKQQLHSPIWTSSMIRR